MMALPEQWLPRSITSLRTYSTRQFTHDLAPGITVGLVALPLAMAFGIAFDVTPQAGLSTAVVAGFSSPHSVAPECRSRDRPEHLASSSQELWRALVSLDSRW